MVEIKGGIKNAVSELTKPGREAYDYQHNVEGKGRLASSVHALAQILMPATYEMSQLEVNPSQDKKTLVAMGVVFDTMVNGAVVGLSIINPLAGASALPGRYIYGELMAKDMESHRS